MWPLIGVVSVFFVCGLVCAGLVVDFRCWRSRWIESGEPDDRLRHARRVAALGIGWVGLLISLYAVFGFGISLLVQR